MPGHLIGGGARSVLEVAEPAPFQVVLRVPGVAAPDRALASMRGTCPRRGVVAGADCADCVHLQG